MKNPVVEFAQAVLDAAALVKRGDMASAACAEAENKLAILRTEADATKARCAAQQIDADTRVREKLAAAEMQAATLISVAQRDAKHIYETANAKLVDAECRVDQLEDVKDELASDVASLRQTVAGLESRRDELVAVVARLKDSVAKV